MMFGRYRDYEEVAEHRAEQQKKRANNEKLYRRNLSHKYKLTPSKIERAVAEANRTGKLDNCSREDILALEP